MVSHSRGLTNSPQLRRGCNPGCCTDSGWSRQPHAPVRREDRRASEGITSAHTPHWSPTMEETHGLLIRLARAVNRKPLRGERRNRSDARIRFWRVAVQLEEAADVHAAEAPPDSCLIEQNTLPRFLRTVLVLVRTARFLVWASRWRDPDNSLSKLLLRVLFPKGVDGLGVRGRCF